MENKSSEEWFDIKDAKKDGTVIWAVFHPSIYPDLEPNRKDLERFNGVQLPLRNLLGDNGFDMGWNIAAPVGYGGFPDEWIIGWKHLPEPPLKGEN